MNILSKMGLSTMVTGDYILGEIQIHIWIQEDFERLFFTIGT